MAIKRVYEVMYIGTPETADEDIVKLNETIEELVVKEGGTVVKTENIGRRKLAYPISKKTEGHYVLFEIEDSGQTIAELERRMRVNDTVIRYITVRVDEERKTAEKHRVKREDRQARRANAAGNFNRSDEEIFTDIEENQ